MASVFFSRSRKDLFLSLPRTRQPALSGGVEPGLGSSMAAVWNVGSGRNATKKQGREASLLAMVGVWGAAHTSSGLPEMPHQPITSPHTSTAFPDASGAFPEALQLASVSRASCWSLFLCLAIKTQTVPHDLLLCVLQDHSQPQIC